MFVSGGINFSQDKKSMPFSKNRNPGICLITNQFKNIIRNFLWRIMVPDVPKIKLTQYFFNNVKCFDKTDYFHLALAFWAHKRINFVNFLDQASALQANPDIGNFIETVVSFENGQYQTSHTFRDQRYHRT